MSILVDVSNGSEFAALNVFVERIAGNPTAHHHHRHAWSRMGGATGKIQSLEITRAIGRLERTQETTVAGNSLDGTIQNTITIVNPLGRQ